jgi:hypothetical protein
MENVEFFGKFGGKTQNFWNQSENQVPGANGIVFPQFSPPIGQKLGKLRNQIESPYWWQYGARTKNNLASWVNLKPWLCQNL